MQRSTAGGSVTVLGGQFDSATWRSALAPILETAGITPVMAVPDGVEALRRVGADGREVVILIEHGGVERQVALDGRWRDHLTGAAAPENLTLAPYGVAVLAAP